MPTPVRANGLVSGPSLLPARGPSLLIASGGGLKTAATKVFRVSMGEFIPVLYCSHPVRFGLLQEAFYEVREHRRGAARVKMSRAARHLRRFAMRKSGCEDPGVTRGRSKIRAWTRTGLLCAGSGAVERQFAEKTVIAEAGPLV